MADFSPGTRIAGYRLEEQIGAGGMAVVFRARDERLGRLVALKILTPARADAEAFRQRFIRESRAAAAVDDPHIIPVFGAGEHNGVLFIAMRYVPGGDARALMHREGGLPPARALAIISQVASTLDAAHGTGLVHRDVKPANMLVDTRPGRPDHVYLSDFGLSRGTRSASGLTEGGQFLGTADYISPEQIQGQPVDGCADQYALACAAFELLAGVPPFRRDEPLAVMYAQLSEPPPSLTGLRPGLPAAADEVLARALAKAPAQRYASCQEFADTLRAAFGLTPYDSGPGVFRAGHPATPAARDEAQPPRPRRGRRWTPATLAASSALSLVAIAVAVILTQTPSRGPENSSARTTTGPVIAAPAAQRPVPVPAATSLRATPVATILVTPTPPLSPAHSVAPIPALAHSVTPTPAPMHSVTPTPAPMHSVTPTPTAVHSVTPTSSVTPTPGPSYPATPGVGY